MLSTALQSRSLTIAGQQALPDVWQNPVESWEIDRLFARLLQPDSVIHYAMQLQNFDLSGMSPAAASATSPQVSTQTLADAIAQIARSHGHAQVTETHLFLALLSLHPHDFEAQFTNLQNQYRQKNPNPSPRMQRLLQMAREKSADAPWVEKLRRSIAQTPLSRSRVVEHLQSYLSARYFPFGSEQFEQYFADKHAGKEPSTTHTADLFGLSNHILRDEALPKK